MEAAKATADQKTKAPAQVEADSPMGNEEFTFTIDWTHPRNGKKYVGDFKNKILTIENSIAVGNMRSLLTASLPYDSLDQGTRNLSQIQAHLAYSLVEKPDWFDPTKLTDPRLVYLVFDEVEAHEQFFRGTPPTSGTGTPGGE